MKRELMKAKTEEKGISRRSQHRKKVKIEFDTVSHVAKLLALI